MFGSTRTGWAPAGALAVTLLLAVSLAACTSTSFHWITPVPSTGTALPVEESIPAEAQTQTPVPEATPAAVEEAGAGDNDAAEAATVITEAAETAETGTAPPITHALARYEECIECHEVGSDRRASPADHEGMTDEVCTYCHMPEEGAAAISALPEKAEAEFCLACHGPQEELMAHTAGYTTEDGLKGNPHMPIPHDKTAVASCKFCHGVHELPVTTPETIEQADLEYCFAACHHERDFEPCTSCHE